MYLKVNLYLGKYLSTWTVVNWICIVAEWYKLQHHQSSHGFEPQPSHMPFSSRRHLYCYFYDTLRNFYLSKFSWNSTFYSLQFISTLLIITSANVWENTTSRLKCFSIICIVSKVTFARNKFAGKDIQSSLVSFNFGFFVWLFCLCKVIYIYIWLFICAILCIILHIY